jgi:tRNA modification GTPase
VIHPLDDTIAAVASAPGGAARGIVRVSGQEALPVLAQFFQPVPDGKSPLRELRSPTRLRGCLRLEGDPQASGTCLPVDLLVWPGTRCYTRQPSVEIHTFGSPPLLAAVIDQLARAGVRPAAAGEFTLRAFLAGRIDLPQAEAVLGVIDARGDADLQAALAQLAGGMTQALHQIRDELLDLLAELEAGLDFVDEDIEFISRDDLADRIVAATRTVSAARGQLALREGAAAAVRVVLAGAPNAGKSCLFNWFVQKLGRQHNFQSLVWDTPGTTRDYVSARVELAGFEFEIVDTAGEEPFARDALDRSAQEVTRRQTQTAEIRIRCVDATTLGTLSTLPPGNSPADQLLAWTKCDLLEDDERMRIEAIPPGLACSTVSGHGMDRLQHELRRQLEALRHEVSRGAAVDLTARRCAGSLHHAERALQDASALLAEGQGEELLAAQIRIALDELGQVVGAVYTDDVLDRVFSQFCIGK